MSRRRETYTATFRDGPKQGEVLAAEHDTIVLLEMPPLDVSLGDDDPLPVRETFYRLRRDSDGNCWWVKL